MSKTYIKMFVDIFESEEIKAKGFMEFLIFFMFFYGCYCILCKVLRFLGFVWVYMFRGCFTSQQKLYTKYGRQGAYAMVTGGSDGIGLEMCHNLAKQGWNIMMVSRNEKKMQQKIEEIKNASGKDTECKYIVADFGKLQTMAEYRETFEFPCKDLDIGIVICNAGYGDAHLVIDTPDDYWEGSLKVNLLHVYYVMKIMSEQLWKRDMRSAMIVTSSLAYLLPFPACVAYSCHKKFVTFLAQGMNMEMSEKIDVMSFNPAGVATKLVKRHESQADGFLITVKTAVDGCFRDLGHTDLTYGAFSHAFQAWMIDLQPNFIWSAMAKDIDKDKIKEEDDKRSKEYEAVLAQKGLQNPNKVAHSDTVA